MCISSQIKKIQAEKEALDAKIARLEELESKTEPIKAMLYQLIEEYRAIAPEELPSLLAEIVKVCGNLDSDPLEVREIYSAAFSQTEAATMANLIQSSVEEAIRRRADEAFSDDRKSDSEEQPNLLADTVEDILTSKGFFQPDVNLGDHYSPDRKYEDYKSWAIYYEQYDDAVTGIGLYNEDFGFWDASTETIGDDDPTFPQSFLNYDAIVAWTLKVIDEVATITPTEAVPPEPTDEQIQEELSLGADDDDEKAVTVEFKIGDRVQWKGDESDTDQGKIGVVNRISKGGNIAWTPDGSKIERVLPPDLALRCLVFVVAGADENDNEESDAADYFGLETVFEAMSFKVNISHHLAGNKFTGATFNFRDADNKLTFSNSLTVEEINGRSAKVCAWDLIAAYREREANRRKPNPSMVAANVDPNEAFVELVKISNAVGYIKRKDNGELLAGYAAFSNKTLNGDRTATSAKPRAQKWADYLAGTFQLVCEVRKAQRITSDISVMPFAYEIKIKGASIGQLQKLSEEDLSLLPNEIAQARTTGSPHQKAVLEAVQQRIDKNNTVVPQTYSVKANSYLLALGTEEKMRSRFEKELLLLGKDGCMSVSLLAGSEVIENYRVNDCNFVCVEDFDAENPEYEVLHRPSQFAFNVWIVAGFPGKWRHTYSVAGDKKFFDTKEAAAVDVVRTMIAKQKS